MDGRTVFAVAAAACTLILLFSFKEEHIASFKEFWWFTVRTPSAVPGYLWVITCVTFVVSQITIAISSSMFEVYSQGYQNLSFVDKREWDSRFVSTVHSSIVFPLCFYVILTDYEFAKDPVNGTNPVTLVAFSIAVGYFMSDFVQIVRHNIPPLLPIMMHHVFAGWAFMGGVSSFGQGLWFGTLLLCTEAANPFTNTYWMLEKANWKQGVCYKFISYMFVITWFLFRIVLNPYLLWKVHHFWGEIMSATIYFRVVFFVNLTFLILLNNIYFWWLGPFFQILFGNSSLKPSVTTAAGSIKGTKQN